MEPDEVDRLEAYVRDQLIGRVVDLRLLRRDNGLVLQGSAHSYFAKQLAQHLVMKVTTTPLLANEIEVL
jgi:hypothetical protein